MGEQFRYIKSDFYKLRHSPFITLHLCFPICGAGIVLIYAMLSKSDEVNKLAAFFQILAIAFPFAIGIVCQIVAGQEAKAGNFQNILTLPHRAKSMVSKLSIMLIFGLLSAILSTALFGVFCVLAGSALAFSFEVIVLIPTVLWGSNILIYVFQYMLAMRFDGNFCIAVGAAGSLAAALLQTGLGTGIWFIIPYGLGIRFSEFALKKVLCLAVDMDMEIKMGILFCVIATSAIMGVVIFWFSRYDGIKS